MTEKREEQLRFYWIGKTNRVRDCVEEYLEGIRVGNRVALRKVRRKYGANENTVRKRLKELRDSGLIDLYLKTGIHLYARKKTGPRKDVE